MSGGAACTPYGGGGSLRRTDTSPRGARSRTKLAVVSEALPPGWSGNAVLIGRLLGGFDPAEYCLLRSDQGTYDYHDGRALPGACYQLPRPWCIPRGTRYGLRIPRGIVNALLGIASRSFHIQRIVKRERCDAILVFTGDFFDLPAAYLAGRRFRLPVYVYMCDDYSYRELWDPVRRWLSSHLERKIVREARGVVCANEVLRDVLNDRHGVEPTVIHHPCDPSLYPAEVEPENGPTTAPRNGELTIVYTGTVYEAQLDALQNLQISMSLIRGYRAVLHIYTGQPRSDLAKWGLRPPFAYHEHRSADGIAAVQREADVLFLPLAFRSHYPEVIRTSAPMKFGEYLAAGRPILAHAPSDSFIARYCRQHDCALIVDTPDPAKLAQATKRLANDHELRRRLTVNARARALADFDLEAARSKFAELVGVESRSPKVARAEAG